MSLSATLAVGVARIQLARSRERSCLGLGQAEAAADLRADSP